MRSTSSIITLPLAVCAFLTIGINFNELFNIMAREERSSRSSNEGESGIKYDPESATAKSAPYSNRSNLSITSTDVEGNTRPLSQADPSSPACLFRDGAPCRFDDMGKYLEASAKFTIVHKPSDAVPTSRRIPKNQGNNATYIAERRSAGPADGSLTALAEYNPTLLPLTSDLDPKLLGHLTGRHHPNISNKEADKAKYLSIARGGNFHICGGGMRRMNNPTKEQSYLVLALLDENLQPIPGASAAVRPFQALMPSTCFKRWDSDPFQDFQIIAARSTKGNEKKDQLFMIASDSSTVIFAIDIRRVPNATNDDTEWVTKLKGKSVNMIATSEQESGQFYGEGLQVRFMDETLPPGKSRLCNAILDANHMDARKNYHIFDDEKGLNEDGKVNVYMEIRPHGVRAHRKVNFYADQFHKFDDWELVPNGTISGIGIRSKTDVTNNQSRGGDPKEQWDHPSPKLKGDARGTACCIDLAWSNNETVKVGISHKVTPERGYVSSFYAFETKTSKFWNVAISGFFCLGSVADYDVNADAQIFPITDKKKLKVGNETYDCPVISFASGLVEYEADPNYAVLSYGVNDCYSRSIVISKDRIREYLTVNPGAIATF